MTWTDFQWPFCQYSHCNVIVWTLNPNFDIQPPDAAHSPGFLNLNTTTIVKYWDFWLAKQGLILEKLDSKFCNWCIFILSFRTFLLKFERNRVHTTRTYIQTDVVLIENITCLDSGDLKTDISIESSKSIFLRFQYNVRK